MKTSSVCLACLVCSLVTSSSLAQGQINWANTSGTLISVHGLPMPVRVSWGTTYYFGLFIAPLGTPPPAQGIDGVTDPNWQYVAAYTMNSTAAAGAGRMLNPGIATVFGNAGTTVNFIVRVWQSTSGGADWAAAKPGLIAIGCSELGTAVLGGGPIPVPSAFGPGAGQIGGFDFTGCMSCFPFFFRVPSDAVVALGGHVTLSAYAYTYNDHGSVRYQWRKQGSLIAGATNSYFSLNHVTLSDAGNYDVVASNNYGGTASPVAKVTVLVPATLGSPTHTSNNQFQFTVTGSAGSNYVVQVATNLAAPTVWVSLLTNTSPFIFVDSNAQNYSQRFYRALAY